MSSQNVWDLKLYLEIPAVLISHCSGNKVNESQLIDSTTIYALQAHGFVNGASLL